MKVKIFIKNTLVLVATSLILRSVGIVFRTYLADKIGSEGMGVYQLIFSVYMLAATFATSGVSTAVTRLVSENIDKGKKAVAKIMRKAAYVTLFAAVISAAVVFFGAKPIAVFLLNEPRATASLKILSFSLPFMGFSSLIRGYFLARRKTLSPSLVQMLEQCVRIATVLFCLNLTKGKGITYMSASVLMGDTVAETVSCIVGYIIYKVDLSKQKGEGTVNKIFAKIMHIALPITGSGYLSTALHTAENLLVPSGLHKFYGVRERGLELFGAVRGMAMPILFFPASFLTSLSTLLIPEVSEAKACGREGEVKRTTERAVEITLTLSILAGAIFLFSGQDLALLLYGDRDVGFVLRVLSPIVPFMYMESVSAGILKGLDRQADMFRYNLFDSCVRIVAVFVLLPFLGIKGYLGIMIVSNSLTSSLCFFKLKKSTEIEVPIGKVIVKPVALAVLGGFLGVAAAKYIEMLLLKIVISVGVQVAVFTVSVFLLGKGKFRFKMLNIGKV